MSLQESSNRSLGSWIGQGQAETECQSKNHGALSTANPFVFLWSFYLLDQHHPRPFRGLHDCSQSLPPQYFLYFILSILQFPILLREQRYSGVKRFVCAISFTSITAVQLQRCPELPRELFAKQGA